MSKLIIGFTGKAGAGKDTAANVLVEHYGFHQVAFADPMRAMMEALLEPAGLEEYMKRDLKEATIPELGVSYRHMMQTLGTEWGRGLGSDFWIRLAGARIYSSRASLINRWVISDVRFPNEAEWIQARGGRVIHIARPGIQAARGHASEAWAGRLNEHYTINNTGSLRDFERTVAKLAAQLTGDHE